MVRILLLNEVERELGLILKVSIEANIDKSLNFLMLHFYSPSVEITLLTSPCSEIQWKFNKSMCKSTLLEIQHIFMNVLLTKHQVL